MEGSHHVECEECKSEEGVDEWCRQKMDWLCADGCVDDTKFGDRRSNEARRIVAGERFEVLTSTGRSNRLRRMDVEGLKEGIGCCMPMETKCRWKRSERGFIRINERRDP